MFSVFGVLLQVLFANSTEGRNLQLLPVLLWCLQGVFPEVPQRCKQWDLLSSVQPGDDVIGGCKGASDAPVYCRFVQGSRPSLTLSVSATVVSIDLSQ